MRHRMAVTGRILLLLAVVLVMGVQSSYARDKEKGWLGVNIRDVNQDVKEGHDLSVDEGALVISVSDGGPADEAGIESGDVIVEYEGRKVRDTDDLLYFVGKTPPGEEVKIKVDRDGKRKEFTAEISGRQSRRSFAWSSPDGRAFSMYVDEGGAFLGVDMMDLTDQLREYFKVKDDEGVLVVTVIEESPAEKIGLKSGDVITKVGKRYIEDSDDLRKAIRKHDPEDEVEIEYVRRGKKSSVKVKLAERENHLDRNIRILGPGSGMRGIYIGEDFDEILDLDLDLDLHELEINLDDLRFEIKENLKHGLKDIREGLRDVKQTVRSRNISII